MGKKILLVVPRFNIGGAESYVMTIALALQKLGHTIFVASGGGMLVERLNAVHIQHFFVPIRLNAQLAATLLKRIVIRHEIEIIHANSAAAGIAAVLVKRDLGIPVVYTAHGVFGHNPAEMTLNECDKMICVSEFVRRSAQSRGFTAEKLITIYNGIDIDKFHPKKENNIRIRNQYDIPQAAFTIAIVARIKNLRDKGHGDLLSVLSQHPDAKDWHLLIIGKGKALWKLKYQAWRLGIRERVHLAGHIVDVQDILDGVDVVALPSQFETFGLVLTEAMAMEKPIVTYAVGGTPEVLENGKEGFLVEKNNINALGERLNFLAGHQLERCSMGKAGRQRVIECFTSEKMMKQVLRVYDELKR